MRDNYIKLALTNKNINSFDIGVYITYLFIHISWNKDVHVKSTKKFRQFEFRRNASNYQRGNHN